MAEKTVFGDCDNCGTPLQPVWFVEEEIRCIAGTWVKTGLIRDAVSYLLCPECGAQIIVDDSFDGPWRNKKKYCN